MTLTIYIMRITDYRYLVKLTRSLCMLTKISEAFVSMSESNYKKVKNIIKSNCTVNCLIETLSEPLES